MSSKKQNLVLNFVKIKISILGLFKNSSFVNIFAALKPLTSFILISINFVGQFTSARKKGEKNLDIQQWIIIFFFSLSQYCTNMNPDRVRYIAPTWVHPSRRDHLVEEWGKTLPNENLPFTNYRKNLFILINSFHSFMYLFLIFILFFAKQFFI